jgi:DNA processing protein
LKSTDLQQQIAVTLLPHFGKKRVRTILRHLGSLDEFFKAKKKQLLEIPGLSEKHIRSIDLDLALKAAEPHADYLVKNGFQSHFYQDESFPKKLNECDDAPLLLYSYGNMDLNVAKTVAIVGTRKASDYGKKLCEELIESFASQNILVVSGLAYGIDIHVHQLCLKQKLQTVGVLAHGLDRLYPAMHRRAARQMLENGGLLTEFLPGTNPDRENFPMRNRIVAGMCDATIVIESGIKGGSLITAELANDYCRDVFAFPGDVSREFSQGCNRLIQQNKAHLITSPEEFLTFMEWGKPVTKQLDLFEKLNEKEKAIVSCFREKMELSFDNLIQHTKLSFSDLSVHLLNLEFSGLVKAFPGKFYRLAL